MKSNPSSDRSTAGRAVYVVDDDPALRDALSSLFRSVGLQVEVFGSAAEFLEKKLPEIPSCLVLDIRLPGVSGLDFQAQLAKAGIRMPVIFMTGHGDIPMSVRAMKAGAIDFLTKPFRDQDMLDAVFSALETDRKQLESDQSIADLSAHYESLTAREKEVMAYVTKGLMNKQIAGEMGLSEITVKIHRGHVMRKMAVRSLADLVRAAEKLGLSGVSA
ncbi:MULTISPECIES: response regulator transcription factor [unclassified Hyphomicrobium]|uniref:response regulator transcription factor n=1 Tax=unclassified Hyphomicrobium TaxID=2619925 RepID=UPI000213D7F8|nr:MULTISPECIES: response regulator transcription factor [unclassified Hyphomicrobium]CCB64383.1 Transcriptional regulatory protein fixJ [Hyphomicrobium sp. MC1]